MTRDEYLLHDGIGLASLLKAGVTNTRTLMDCAISMAKEHGQHLNTICHPEYESAVDWAESWEPKGIFQGIPFLLKDSGIASVKLASSLGSRLFANTRFQFDSTLSTRFENAGFLPFARTTVPEFCMAPTTEAAVYGQPSRNPWDLSRSSGGSSGGAAAAVAAGIVPIAHGSDGGGSIRIPAACCGVYGLKPSRGLVPMGPTRGEGWGGLACDGVLSRTVRDTAAVLDAIAGPETGAPYAAPAKAASYLESVEHEPERPLKIAVWREAWSDISVDPEPILALETAVRLCHDLGHEIIDMPTPEIDYDGFIRGLTQVMAANIKVATDTRLKVLGRTLKSDDLEPAILDGYAFGSRLAASDYVSAIQQFHTIGRIFATAMLPFDLVLTPALTTLPPKLGVLSMRQESFVDFRKQASRYTPFLAVVNAAGLPAACVPIYRTDCGLPVSCQILGPFGREDRVLQLSAQFERVNPWAQHLPAKFDSHHK